VNKNASKACETFDSFDKHRRLYLRRWRRRSLIEAMKLWASSALPSQESSQHSLFELAHGAVAAPLSASARDRPVKPSSCCIAKWWAYTSPVPARCLQLGGSTRGLEKVDEIKKTRKCRGWPD
jgi:hypothetical protein